MNIKKDGVTEHQIARANEEGHRLFLRYDIGLSRRGFAGWQPWKALYRFIAGLKPIAGNIQRNKDTLTKDVSQVTMWFICRTPALPQEIIDWLGESGYQATIEIDSWAFGPSGVKGMTEEDVEALENVFNSNIVMREFLSMEEEEKEQ